jgi:hypothetical protein
MAFRDITFKPNFAKLDHLIRKLKGDTRNMAISQA